MIVVKCAVRHENKNPRIGLSVKGGERRLYEVKLKKNISDTLEKVT